MDKQEMIIHYKCLKKESKIEEANAFLKAHRIEMFFALFRKQLSESKSESKKVVK